MSIPRGTKTRPAARQSGRNARRADAETPPESLLVAFFDVRNVFPIAKRTGTEARILDGARRCFFHYGPDKFSMNEVAQMAGVSRASLYNYFPNREALIEAVVDLVGEVFAEDLGRAMARAENFEQQVVEGIRTFQTWISTGRAYIGAPSYDHIMQVFSVHPDLTFARTMEAVKPFVALARSRGELRSELDVDQVAEWTTRLMWSFVSFRPQTFDSDDPAKLASFVESHLMPGLRPS